VAIISKSLTENPRHSAIILLLGTLISIVWANSPWALGYTSMATNPVIAFWINDGLMAIFFLLVGLEIKRELFIGHLNSLRKASLPLVAAIGGMAFPAIIFVLFNINHKANLSGWGIPMATDIAFAICVLGLLGKRIPRGLLVLLTAIAIVDDLGAVAVIAIFYNHGFSIKYLSLALVVVIMLYALNRAKFNGLWLYLLLGLALWLALLRSGVHATVAGVLLAFFIPIKAAECSPLLKLEHCLKLPVMFGIVPLFILVNAGVSLSAHTLVVAWHNPITWGVSVGLLVGKVLGIFGLSSILIKLDWLHLPENVPLRLLFPMSIIAGIGFTMSLFIAELAFPGQDGLMFAKVGILTASLIAALLGLFMTWQFTKPN